MSFCGRPISPSIPMPLVKPPKQSRETLKMSNRVRLTQRMSNKMLKLAKEMMSENQQDNQSREVNVITDEEVASLFNDVNELALISDNDLECDGDTIGRMHERNQNPANKTMHDRIATRFDTLGNRLHKIFCDSSSFPSTQETVSVPPPAIEPQKDFEDEVLDFYAKEGKKFMLCKKEENGLWRIRACKDFGDVKKGDYGGLVESEDNLSQYGECWIYEGARIIGKRKVFGTQKIVPDENNMA